MVLDFINLMNQFFDRIPLIVIFLTKNKLGKVVVVCKSKSPFCRNHGIALKYNKQ
jgi:hypothetical protein